MKVLYITNLPAPYKIEFFSRLGDKVELTVAYERKQATNRDRKWVNDTARHSFKEIYLDGLKVGADTSCSLKTIALIRNGKFDRVIMNGFSSPTAMLAIAYMQFHNIKYGIMCDGMLPGKCNWLKNRLKNLLISGADYYLSSNSITSQVLEYYGAKKNRIYLYPFSSVTSNEIIEERYEKEVYKEKIGCAGKKVILYIGQFIHRKGIDILIEAYKKLANRQNHLILIGGMLPYGLSSELVENVTNIGFKKTEELENYYKAADVFVLPTREDIWGLVVNEAMAKGVPVVTTDRWSAGIAMIENGRNGYIVPVESVDQLASKIISALEHSEEMRENVIQTAKKYTIDNMVNETYEILS